MATKTILWGNGYGSIFLDYTGQGNGTIAVTSDGNNLYTSRSKTITVSGGGTSRQVSIVQSACPRSKGYLAFIAEEDGTFAFTGNNVFYSLDDGSTWVELVNGESTPTITSGSTIIWKASITPNNSIGVGTFSSTGNFRIQGNPMSLLFGDAFVGRSDFDEKSYAHYRLFEGCTKLTNADGLYLPATTLTNSCYQYMFYGCTSLASVAFDLLPATTLTDYCYSDMFRECSSLVVAPCLLAETLVTGCYSGLFRDCTSLEYVQAMFTAIPSNIGAITNWLNNVATYGVFVNSQQATWAKSDAAIFGTWVVEPRRALPSGYKQLFYMASTKSGGEYIDFNLLMWTETPLSYALDISCYPIGKGKDDHNQATFLSNLLESGNYPGFLIRINNNFPLTQNRNPNTNYARSGAYNQITQITQSQGNGSAKDFTPDRGTNNVSLTLFCEKSASGVAQRFYEARVYHVKIKSNGDDWVRDCVPAKDSNGVIGLYDMANGVFYTTPQGAFIGGVELL